MGLGLGVGNPNTCAARKKNRREGAAGQIGFLEGLTRQKTRILESISDSKHKDTRLGELKQVCGVLEGLNATAIKGFKIRLLETSSREIWCGTCYDSDMNNVSMFLGF